MTALKLSSSIGGAPTYLTDDTLPGLLVHENPADSGENHLIQEILVVNPNPSAITLWTTIQGPGIPVPTAQDPYQMTRINVPATAEGNEPRVFYTPFILYPGYSYHVSTQLLAGQEPAYLFGYVDTFPSTVAPSGGYPLDGYGGLVTRVAQAMPDLAINAWDTIPFTDNALPLPLNFTQDATNNRFTITKAGIWDVRSYGIFEYTKEASTDRVIFTRLWDETDGVSVPTGADNFPIFAEGGSEGNSWSWTTPVDIPAELVNHLIRVELGGCQEEPFTGLSLLKAGISAGKWADL